ncbi:hypothetical protein [Sinomonas sp. ASV322]|uniref:hypothetical protein n=1 Tax=Sinomonas sp. ASV322 TaxID=3041920 RepID=UPI0027DBA55B|nr:hypothetical protein [Sinomonas sp. ASV322]MDQ4503644.1 hypothetical protein [Sinomonas sp. ASV322]
MRFSPSSIAVAATLPIALLLGGCASNRASAESTSVTNSRQWLLTADTSEKALYVNSVADGKRTGVLDNVRLGAHAGAIQLGGGRLAFVDESVPCLDILAIDDGGTPKIEHSYVIPPGNEKWERAGWIATDPTKHYIAVGSDFDGSTTQQVTLVDLTRNAHWTVPLHINEVTLATTGKTGTEEMHTFLAGDPLRLVVTSGGRLDAYLVSDITSGNPAPVPYGSTALGAYPHGPLATAKGDRIASTLRTGIASVALTSDGFGESSTTDYPAGHAQNYRPRIAPDGTTYLGTQAGVVPKETSWDRTPAYLLSGSMAGGPAATVALGEGIFARASVSSHFAATSMAESSGDSLVLVARNEKTGFFDGRVSKIKLTPLAAGPVVGQDAKKAEARFVAATDDGLSVFVTRGGEGKVTQVDTASSRERRTIDYPTKLTGGGYITVVDAAVDGYDLNGR